MAFTVDTDPNVVIVVFSTNFNLQREAEALWEALDTQPNPATLIFNTLDATISAKDLILSTDEVSQAILRHENVRETLVITEDKLVQIAAKGVNSISFGYIRVQAYIRACDSQF